MTLTSEFVNYCVIKVETAAALCCKSIVPPSESFDASCKTAIPSPFSGMT